MKRASRRLTGRKFLVATASVLGLVGLGGCAAGAGSGDSNGQDSSGFEYGASQEEVNEAIADLEPITLTYQPAANSAEAPGNEIAHEFKEKVESRSNGQITVDIVWGHGIASIEETEDALADGRIDVSHAVPIYKPQEFPEIDALSNLLGTVGGSPMEGELIANAVAADLAWGTPDLLQSYEDAGIVPLVPAYGGGYYTMCTEPGGSADDWDGRQLRIASTAQAEQATAINATPVSLEYPELYEAMQRNVIDCTSLQLNTAAIAGLFEVAPNITYTNEVSFTRALSATLAGANFKDLPLAYQQIIFDNAINEYAVTMHDFFDTGSEGIAQAKDLGGEIEEFDTETVEALKKSNEEIVADISEGGSLGEDVESRLTESIEKWQNEVAELGLEDEGTLANFDEWYDGSTDDFRELGRMLFEETALNHRPE